MSPAKKRPPLGPAGSRPGITRAEIETDLEFVEGAELSADEIERFEAAVDLADAELEARATEDVRVNFRWERGSLAVVKRAAALAGVPYQTYIKQVLYQRAIADLRAAAMVDPRATRSS